MKCPKCGFISFDFLETCKHCNAKLGDVRKMVGPIGARSAQRTVLLESTGAGSLNGTGADFEFSEGGGAEGVIEFGLDEAEDNSMSPVADFQEPEPVSSEVAQSLFDFASDDEDIQEIQLDLSEMEEGLSFEPELDLGTTDESLGDMGEELDIPLEEIKDEREFSLTSDDLDLLSEPSGRTSGDKDAGDSLFIFDDEPGAAKDKGAWELDDDAGVETFTLDETPFEKIEEEDASTSPVAELSDDLSLDFELEAGGEAPADVSGPGEGIEFSGLTMEKDEPEELELEPVEAAAEATAESDEGIDVSDISLEKDEPEELELEPVETAAEAAAELDEGIDFSGLTLEKNEPEELEPEPVEAAAEAIPIPDEGFDVSDLSFEKNEPEELEPEPVEAAAEAISIPDEGIDIADLSMDESGPEDMDVELPGEAGEPAFQAGSEIEPPASFEFDSAGEDISFSFDETAEVSEGTESEIKTSPMLDVDDLENGLNDLEEDAAAGSREAGPDQVFDISAELDESGLPDLSLEQLGEDEIFQSGGKSKPSGAELHFDEELPEEEPPVVSLDDDPDADLEELAKDFEAELKDIELEVAADMRMSDDEVMAAIPDVPGRPTKYEV